MGIRKGELMKFTIELEDIVRMRATIHGYRIAAKHTQYDLISREGGKRISIDVSGMEELQNSGLDAVLELVEKRIRDEIK